MKNQIEISKRYSQPFSLIIVDIDYFKKFNDTYGHQAGDAVLRQVAQTLKKNSRTTDIVCRYGGVEYKSQSALERAYDLRKGVIANLRRRNPEIANNMRAIMRKALTNKELKRRAEIKVEQEPIVDKVSIHGPIKAKQIEAYGVIYPSQKEMSRILGMEKNYVASALRRGLTPEEIVDNARRIQEKRARNK